jgi:hypothetical protein
MDILIGILLGLFGLFVTFAGLRVFFVALPIVGFFLGFFVGTIGLQELFGHGFLGTVASWIVGLVLGIVFALVSYLWWYVGALLSAGAVGASLGSGLVALLGQGDGGWLAVIVGAIGFVLFFVGALLLNLPIYIVIVNTAVAGAFLTIAGALVLFGRIGYQELGDGAAVAITEASFIWVLALVVLAVAGIVAQLNMIKDVTLPEQRWAVATTS